MMIGGLLLLVYCESLHEHLPGSIMGVLSSGLPLALIR